MSIAEKDAKKEIAKRIKAALDLLDITQKQASLESGIPHASIRNWANALSYPSAEFLAYLSRKGINVNWVLTGEGEPLQKKD